ncbi:PREDICTED: aspartate--tRNA ligase, mitochondrial-like [Amphimedon queenslandica]|uniref:Aminoacyl-transfer RNA synthetases class-II family profile domain-containing protein n=2 Tax=Amphimedon queenslandica TaxID=400682 RepID=A0AAN0IPF3_AMPQE|nr:PREDICTED: aspartate--tRNA ligase, mitochondrial-like [Amphimedon queenslandica]|eukprot:XP_011406016.1 PREDICTED: aspartate--tRNA ligase, mitochondrial-like [Amphimedon queenslandica]
MAANAAKFLYRSRCFSSFRWYSASSYTYRTHTCGELRKDHVGSHVTLCGWTQKSRVMGKVGVVFVPLSDATGTTQVVTDNEEHREVLQSLPTESVVLVEGVVSDRPGHNLNKDMSTGDIEVQAKNIKILNKSSESLSFYPFSKAGGNTTEEMRLRERCLEIRRHQLQNILRFRSKVSSIIRQYLISEGFIEVETPTLFKPTPEGAREYLVPTREKGKFYSLAQSPQQFKQLLMVGGVDRYFQFARCYRDETSRVDRQPEFTQIDLEMSFTSAQDLMSLIESMMTQLLKSLDYKFTAPFPVMTYREAMDDYGSDKPDTRLGMKFNWLSEKFKDTSTLVAFDIPKEFLNQKKGLSFDTSVEMSNGIIFTYRNGHVNVIADGGGVLSESIINDKENTINKLKEILGDRDCVVTSFDEEKHKDSALDNLGKFRIENGSFLKETKELHSQFELLWVTGFPLFEEEEEGGGTVIKSVHHPFTAPVPEHEELMYSTDANQLTKIVGQQYDLVVNGWELGGGSIRIHNPLLQEHVFENILKAETTSFSHLIKGLWSGCPPHGGIALGLDRLIALLCNTKTIKEVIAFPKSLQGYDAMCGSPATLTDDQLLEYHLKIN